MADKKTIDAIKEIAKARTPFARNIRLKELLDGKKK